MEDEKKKDTNSELPTPKATNSSHVVMADSVEAEEVPTIPLGSLQTISTLKPEITVHSIEATEVVSMPTPLVVHTSEYRRTFGEWVRIWGSGLRSGYLVLPLMPVLVGSALAWTDTVSTHVLFGRFHIFHFIGAIIVLTFMQLGANLVNDYYDYLRGVDTTNTLGPGGLIQQGLIKPTVVLILGLGMLGLGVLGGVVIALAGGALVFLFGLIGVVCAFFYSATRRILSSMGLGEIMVFAIYGPLITMGAYMVQVGHFSSKAFIYSLPLGLLATAVIHVNNMRDIESDTSAKKYTLASVLGFRWSRIFYLLLVLGAYGIILGLGIPHLAPHLILLCLWTLPGLIIVITGILRTDTPAALHILMCKTRQLELAFALLLMVGLIGATLLGVLPHIPGSLL